MTLSEEDKKKVEGIINQKKVFLMMKGTPDFPQCGFSMRAVQVLKKYGVDFASFNVFEDPITMDQIKEYADWPTTPQLFVEGDLVGGSDIIVKLDESGELEKIFKKAGVLPSA